VVELVDAGGGVKFVSSLTLPDRDPATAKAVTQEVSQGNDQAATKALQAAQHIPELKDFQGNPCPRREPEITPELKKEVLDKQPEFVRLTLYDACDEDGDVVEVLVNGISFAVVPLTHKGAELCIPVPQGGGRITLRGVRDGVGGITVGGRTSRGDIFWAAMRVGEEMPLDVVTR
jgi:hypothetical protein